MTKSTIFAFRVFQTLNKLMENKCIFYRKIAVVLYDVENYEKLNLEKPEYMIKRINAIDQETEDKIKKALQQMDFRPLPFDLEEAKKRLENKYRFVVIEHDGEFVGWTWDAVGFMYIPELEETIRLKDREAFSFNTYIHKDHRNKGLNKLMLHGKVSFLQDENFTKEWGHIWSWNIPSLTSFTHMGWKIIGYYYYFKIFCIKIRYRGYKRTECSI